MTRQCNGVRSMTRAEHDIERSVGSPLHADRVLPHSVRSACTIEAGDDLCRWPTNRPNPARPPLEPRSDPLPHDVLALQLASGRRSKDGGAIVTYR